MDKYTENKYGYFNELSLEKLKNKREELKEEISYAYSIINNRHTSSEQISETMAELPYYEEQLAYIETLINSKESDKKKR